jgi:hypothetical protein
MGLLVYLLDQGFVFLLASSVPKLNVKILSSVIENLVEIV